MAGEGNKLALGTVQFGLPYGISNNRGQVPEPEVCEILAYAAHQQIIILDTAAAYGTSEMVLGNCLEYTPNTFDIISKLPPASKPENVEANVLNSLKQLRVSHLFGYLFHDINDYQKYPETLKKILNFKERGIIQNIGFSLYFPHQLEFLLQNNIPFDMVQIPFNVFDQRFASLFPELQKKNIQVHARSVFLQGLLLTPPEKVNSYFKPLVPALKKLHQLANNKKVSLPHVCLGFAHLFPAITNLVIGVTSLVDLKENIRYTGYLAAVEEVLPDLTGLAQTEENFLLPFNWKNN